jgi:hypothetical protein
VFPGVMEHVETHLGPGPAAPADPRVRLLRQRRAIYHMEPIEDLTCASGARTARSRG